MQRCHEEQSARSKGAPLSPLEAFGILSDRNMAKLVRALFLGGVAQASRNMLHNGVSH